ncbi:MAG TPA: M28 family peptidase [Ohtaekwangia sp.]|uniref:M28 family peptidase n=1 Tax=Ohtaekwangia sp. TaxID=2066019 RepID=UPI002F956EDE
MKKCMCMVLALITAGNLLAQDPAAKKYGDLITPADLKENLSILASDAMEGRETGKRGQKMAAAFVKANFEDFGLAGPVSGGFYQNVELYTSMPGDIYLKSGQTKFLNFQEVVFYGSSDSGGEVTVPVVFVGKGRKEDFDLINVEGKAAVIQQGAEENYRAALTLARERKAKVVLIYNADVNAYKELSAQLKDYLSEGILSVKKPEAGEQRAGVFFISQTAAAKVLNTTIEKLSKAVTENTVKKVKPATITYKTAMDIHVLKSDNVLGYLEGTDKKDELLVISAHYDHIGKIKGTEGDLINNGADDDGSGTVSVIQLAKAFTQAKKEGKGPRRSILFLLVTGEEKGLLGSDYYTQHPVFPLDKTVVDLNIDMVGRRDPQHKDSAPYVYVIGSDKLSTELHNLNEAQNKAHTNLLFDYTYNDQNHPDRLYYRSDHWNFAKNNIPIVFYFDGIHEDYHKPSDEVSKIEFDLMALRAQCVFYTAWEIANRDQRIVADKK